jgi:hypothetical protein
MRSRIWELAMLGGLAVAASSALNLVTPIGNSLLLGAGIGLFVAAPVSGLALEASDRRKVKAVPPPKVRLKQLVEVRRKVERVEHEKILDNFDAMMDKVEERKDPEAVKEVDANFATFVDKLTRHYPQWNSEGRLRTYVLMNMIADSINSKNADRYLDMAYRTLVARGMEAAEISRMSLHHKVEGIYNDPENEGNRRLAGTLLLMNRADETYAMNLVVDAIHLWSDTRFERLRQDFEAISVLERGQKEDVLDLLEREMAKSKRAKDGQSAKRARQLWKTVLSSGPASS